MATGEEMRGSAATRSIVQPGGRWMEAMELAGVRGVVVRCIADCGLRIADWVAARAGEGGSASAFGAASGRAATLTWAAISSGKRGLSKRAGSSSLPSRLAKLSVRPPKKQVAGGVLSG